MLLYGEEGNEQMSLAIDSADATDAPIELLPAKQLRHRFPQFRFDGDALGVWDVQGAAIRPERTVEVTAGLAKVNGATVREFTRVLDVSPEGNGNGVAVTTSEGTEYFDRAVVACGGWTPTLLPHINEEVVAKRLTSMWFTGESEDYFAGMPPFLRAAPSYCYGLPTRDGRSVKVGLGFNDHYPTGDPDTLPRQLVGEDLEEQLRRFAWIREDMLPGLSARPYRVGTYVESYSRSMLEYIRPDSRSENILVMTGFSGHGFRVAPAAGEVGCQLILEGKSAVDVSFMQHAAPEFTVLDAATGLTTHSSVMASRTLGG